MPMLPRSPRYALPPLFQYRSNIFYSNKTPNLNNETRLHDIKPKNTSRRTRAAQKASLPKVLHIVTIVIGCCCIPIDPCHREEHHFIDRLSKLITKPTNLQTRIILGFPQRRWVRRYQGGFETIARKWKHPGSDKSNTCRRTSLLLTATFKVHHNRMTD